MKRMTVGDLKRELESVPDDFEVLVWDIGQGGLVGAYIDRLDNEDPNLRSLVIDAVNERPTE